MTTDRPSTRRRASFTAAGVARARARLDRPMAPAGDADAGRRLACDLPVPFPVRRGRTLLNYMRGRTRFFDGVVMNAVAGKGQIVLIGAGYDDRSLRFRTPGVQFLEVDHPATQADKRARLDRLGIDASDVRFVPLDLEHEAPDTALHGVLVPTLPTTIITEAVVPYLGRAHAEAVLAALARVPGRPLRLALDIPIIPVRWPGRVALAMLRAGTAAVGEPIRTVIAADELDGLLARAGWKAETKTTGSELGMPAATRELLFVSARPVTDLLMRHRIG